jgi:general stress protein 26
MEATLFSDIENEFLARIRSAIYCCVATIDALGRPRTRVMHRVWDGLVGWVITDPKSLKMRHLAQNPYVSIAYVADVKKPVYVECMGVHVDDPAEKERIWQLYKEIEPPLGFDPEPYYGTTANPLYGLLRFEPTRIELAELGGKSLVWRA